MRIAWCLMQFFRRMPHDYLPGAPVADAPCVTTGASCLVADPDLLLLCMQADFFLQTFAPHNLFAQRFEGRPLPEAVFFDV